MWRDIYNSLVKHYPKQDAKYILPLATKTEEVIQVPIGREMGKWANYLQELYFTEAKEIGKLVMKWNEEKSGLEVYELPPPESFMPLRIRDSTPLRDYQYANLKNAQYFPLTDTLVFRFPGSIASFHYEVRNRQELLLWPSWEEVVYHEKFVMPESMKKTRRGYTVMLKTSG